MVSVHRDTRRVARVDVPDERRRAGVRDVDDLEPSIPVREISVVASHGDVLEPGTRSVQAPNEYGGARVRDVDDPQARQQARFVVVFVGDVGMRACHRDTQRFPPEAHAAERRGDRRM